MVEVMNKPRPIRLAVLISGGGTTLQNLADQIQGGQLDAKVVLVVSSNDQAYGLERATGMSLPSLVVPRKQFPDTRAFSARVFDAVRETRADLVCLAGFLCLLDLPDDFATRVINIHPALLPSFGGQGMYGQRVHEAVLEAGCKVSGCTVHYCDQTYDTGPIIIQQTCPVAEGDTPQSLAQRVFEQECDAYPESIRLIAQGRVEIQGRRTRILPQSSPTPLT